MNPGIAILFVVCGWSLLSILVSLGFGGAAKGRDRHAFGVGAVPARAHRNHETGARRSA